MLKQGTPFFVLRNILNSSKQKMVTLYVGGVPCYGFVLFLSRFLSLWACMCVYIYTYISRGFFQICHDSKSQEKKSGGGGGSNNN